MHPRREIQLLKRNGVELAGREAVAVGRSNFVGKPLAQLLLLRENATVCHSRTRDLLPGVTRRAVLLVVAAGQREMIGAEHVKEDAVVVDIHRGE